MKKINIIFALSAIALTSVSCSSNKDEAIIPQENEKIHVSFEVSSENPGVTRADLNVTGNGYASMVWVSGDQIGLSADDKFHVDAITVEVDDKSTNTERATASGMVDDTPEGYLCVYPATAFAQKKDKNSAVVKIEDIQNIDKGFQICQAAFLQVGYSKKSSNNINMETPCSFLVFNTGNNDNIVKVKVSAFDEQEGAYSIAGAILVKKTGTSGFDQEPGNEVDGHFVTNEVVCTYNYNDSFPVRHNFAIAIRPGRPHHLNIEVTFKDENGNESTKKYTADKMDDEESLEFDRHEYYQFPTF